MDIIKEIKIVGLKDWLWFNIVLNRDEFHRSLDIIKYILYIKIGGYTIDIHHENIKLLERRTKAHNIDVKLREYNE
jgi:hypothetical protein